MNLEKTLFAFSIGEKGVIKIDIDYMTDSVIVEFEPTFITKEEIRKGSRVQVADLLELLGSSSSFL